MRDEHPSLPQPPTNFEIREDYGKHHRHHTQQQDYSESKLRNNRHRDREDQSHHHHKIAFMVPSPVKQQQSVTYRVHDTHPHFMAQLPPQHGDSQSLIDLESSTTADSRKTETTVVPPQPHATATRKNIVLTSINTDEQIAEQSFPVVNAESEHSEQETEKGVVEVAREDQEEGADEEIKTIVAPTTEHHHHHHHHHHSQHSHSELTEVESQKQQPNVPQVPVEPSVTHVVAPPPPPPTQTSQPNELQFREIEQIVQLGTQSKETQRLLRSVNDQIQGVLEAIQQLPKAIAQQVHPTAAPDSQITELQQSIHLIQSELATVVAATNTTTTALTPQLIAEPPVPVSAPAPIAIEISKKAEEQGAALLELANGLDSNVPNVQPQLHGFSSDDVKAIVKETQKLQSLEHSEPAPKAEVTTPTIPATPSLPVAAPVVKHTRTRSWREGVIVAADNSATPVSATPVSATTVSATSVHSDSTPVVVALVKQPETVRPIESSTNEQSTTAPIQSTESTQQEVPEDSKPLDSLTPAISPSQISYVPNDRVQLVTKKPTRSVVVNEQKVAHSDSRQSRYAWASGVIENKHKHMWKDGVVAEPEQTSEENKTNVVHFGPGRHHKDQSDDNQ
eukprot:c9415_g1_i1.p1 GENE.c9415_g1_i1~~c9415_g1_i1.p1  ORF type:complete len:670 (+),score=227.40 c9415_g1_i1:150-2012(+)